MTLLAFSIYDDKAETFSPPFYVPAAGLATRTLDDLVKDKSTKIAQHPDDFKLYKLGRFNDKSGKLEADAEPTFIANASDFLVGTNNG